MTSTQRRKLQVLGLAALVFLGGATLATAVAFGLSRFAPGEDQAPLFVFCSMILAYPAGYGAVVFALFRWPGGYYNLRSYRP